MFGLLRVVKMGATKVVSDTENAASATTEQLKFKILSGRLPRPTSKRALTLPHSHTLPQRCLLELQPWLCQGRSKPPPCQFLNPPLSFIIYISSFKNQPCSTFVAYTGFIAQQQPDIPRFVTPIHIFYI